MKRRVGLAVLAILLGASPLAWAYVPPSAFLVKKVADKKRGFSAVVVRTTVGGMRGDRPTGARFKSSTTVDYAAKKVRVRAFDEEGRELYAAERDLNAIEPTPTGSHILFGNQVETLGNALKLSGVPIRSDQELLALASETERRSSEQTSIVRYDGKVAWVVGPKTEFKPQLWIEKDQFLPTRLVVKRAGSVWDMRFQNYRFTRDFPFPHAILIREDGPEDSDLVLREELLEVSLTPPAREMKAVKAPGFTDAGNRIDSDIRRLIVTYFQIAR